MNEAAWQVGQVEGLRAGTEVTVSVHEALQQTIGRREHRVRAQVELAAIYQ